MVVENGGRRTRSFPANYKRHRQRIVSGLSATVVLRGVDLDRPSARRAEKDGGVKDLGQCLHAIDESRAGSTEKSTRVHRPHAAVREPAPILLLQLHRTLPCRALHAIAAR